MRFDLHRAIGAPLLTREEARKLELRSAKPGDNRIGYELVVPITIPDRRELEARARQQLRSLSSYVAKLIVDDLGGRS
jgi:hypothetical protein